MKSTVIRKKFQVPIQSLLLLCNFQLFKEIRIKENNGYKKEFPGPGSNILRIKESFLGVLYEPGIGITCFVGVNKVLSISNGVMVFKATCYSFTVVSSHKG